MCVLVLPFCRRRLQTAYLPAQLSWYDSMNCLKPGWQRCGNVFWLASKFLFADSSFNLILVVDGVDSCGNLNLNAAIPVGLGI